MLGFLKNYFNKYFVKKEEFDNLKKASEDLQIRLAAIELISAEIVIISKKQSELINQIAAVQGDIISAFMTSESANIQLGSPNDSMDMLESLLLTASIDDDLVN